MAITELTHATNIAAKFANGIAKKSVSLSPSTNSAANEVKTPVDSFVSSRPGPDENANLSDQPRKLSYSNHAKSSNFQANTGRATTTFGKPNEQDLPSSFSDWMNTGIKFSRWVNGRPIKWQYGPESREVKDLMTAPKVEAARRYYAEKNFDPSQPAQGVTDYTGKFRVSEFLEASNPPNSTKYFVGGFMVDIMPVNSGSQIEITVTNTTSLPSLLYHFIGVPEIKTHRAPMSNQTQICRWIENAPALPTSTPSMKTQQDQAVDGFLRGGW